jgi:hypothetical protein
VNIASVISDSKIHFFNNIVGMCHLEVRIGDISLH